MAKSFIDSLMDDLQKTDKTGVIATVTELRENQYGLPLRHYAQQYLFGATGLRLKVFHSISGIPASCKSPLLFDLMGHICASPDNGGLGGVGFLYELEDKISPTLLSSMMSKYGGIIENSFKLIQSLTIEGAIGHMTRQIIPAYRKNVTASTLPLVIGFDSIGGASSSDTVKKIVTDGAAGKGFYDKAHYMKYFCENAGQLMGDIPMIIICVNQEKEQAAATSYGPPQKKITGGASQVFKGGHMISASFKNMATGDAKLITLRTTKTSFCDSRRIEVMFRWNKFGTDDADAYGHHFEWALAAAKCIAAPDKGVGEIRDICDVKVSDADLVTCPQLSCKSVPAEEFEAALMAPENAKLLCALQLYQKIERIKGMDEYAVHMKELKKSAKGTEEEPEPAPEKAATKAKAKPAKKPPPKPISKPLLNSEGDPAEEEAQHDDEE